MLSAARLSASCRARGRPGGRRRACSRTRHAPCARLCSPWQPANRPRCAPPSASSIARHRQACRDALDDAAREFAGLLRHGAAREGIAASSRASRTGLAGCPARAAGFHVKTLNRLLIANRGEIAVRIARTARRLGITTIAVCSDADRDAPHVAACDEHVPIGGHSPAESYLSIDKLLDAAARVPAPRRSTRATGSCPENARFAAAVEAAGLIFVGPPADRHRRDGRQGARPPAHGRRRHPGRAGLRRRGAGRSAARRRSAAHRLPGHGEGRGRRRRARHAPGEPRPSDLPSALRSAPRPRPPRRSATAG